VAGLVALWGRIVRGHKGVYRAQYAYPAAFWALPQDWITQLASVYGVPILPVPDGREQLLAQAAEVRATWVHVPGSVR